MPQNLTLRCAFYESHLDNVPTSDTLSWSELAEVLTTFPEPTCTVETCAGRDCQAKYGPAWSPVDIEGPRANTNVRGLTAAVFDLDHVQDFEGVLARIAEYAYAIHTTHSHSIDDRCYRLVFPLSRPVKREEWATVRATIVEALELPADPQVKDASRLYFLPTSRGGAERFARVHEGEVIDVEDVLAAAGAAPARPVAKEVVPVDLAALRARLSDVRRSKSSSADPRQKEQAQIIGRILDGEPLAQLGERDGTILRAMGLLAYWLPAETPWEAVLEILRPSLATMPRDPEKSPPETFEYLAGVAKQKYERQQVSRRAADEKRAADDACIQELVRAVRSKGAPLPEDVSEDDPDAWKETLIETKGGLRACEYNARLIIACAPELRGTIYWNEFTKDIEVRGGPFQGTTAEVLDTAIAGWMQRHYECFVSPSIVRGALLQVAYENRRDPIAEHLGELAWDGTPRIDTFLERYFGVAGEEKYTRAVSRRWLISLVARALLPGCKVDTVLILEGLQGAGKSTALEAIAGTDYYLDTALTLGDRDAYLAIAGAWLVELGELASFNKAETEKVRQFLSLKQDKFRLPYGRVVQVSPRRCVFVGTTNSYENYLTDREGNRRYWPVRVGAVDIRALRADRDQILAEAVAAFRAGDRWWFEGEEIDLAAHETGERLTASVTEEKIEQWWYSMQPNQRPRRFGMLEVLETVLKVPAERIDQRGVTTNVGISLRKLGFRRSERIGKERTRYYEPSEEMLTAPTRLSAAKALADRVRAGTK